MIVVIAGPTGVGKTKLSIALAKHFNTEIISGDSVQVYQGLNIGSAKITDEEKAGIKHYMLDILLPHEPFSVALYQRLVRKHIDTFLDANKLPLIVGGTGFYIKSVLHDFDFQGAHRPIAFDEQYAAYDNQALHDALNKVDHQSAENIHQNNRKRVLQALYRALHSNSKRSEQAASEKAVYDYLIIGLTMPRKELHMRIEDRVNTMFEAGLLEEVEGLYYLYKNTQSLEAIGYKEIIGYIEGHYSLETAKTLIKTHTRRYAKRQYTYFNNQFDTKWLEVDTNDFDKTVQSAIKLIESYKKQR